MENQMEAQQLDTYEMNFDVLLNKTIKIKARDENEALDKLEKMLDEKDILRAHVNNVSFKIVK